MAGANDQTDRSTNDAATSSHDRLTVFAFLWACQSLVHQQFFYEAWLPDNVWGWMVTLLALAVLVRPRSIVLLSALLACSITYNVGRWPYVPNHILVESVISATMLGAFAWTFMLPVSTGAGKRTYDPSRRDIAFNRFSPVVVALVVIMYGWAFVAKLNTDFFDLDVSCVNELFPDLQRRVPFLPNNPSTLNASLWATLAIEGAIPVLLVFRRTRPLGVVIGLLFHFMLGLVGYRTFSAMVYVLYFLFVSDEFTSTANAIERRLWIRYGAERRRLGIRLGRVGGLFLVASLISLSLAGLSHSGPGPFTADQVAWLIWIVWSVLMMGMYGYSFVQATPEWKSWPAVTPLARAAPRLLWLVVPIVFLNGATQYIGLKTEGSFTMYSNVRTEGETWNHLILPRWLRFMPLQDDLIEVIETDDVDIAELTADSALLPMFEFRRVVNDIDGDGFVRYFHGGSEQVVTVRDGEVDQPDLSNPSWLARKLLYFRPVDPGTDQSCRH